LEEDSISTKPSATSKYVSLKNNVLRIHQGSTGHVALEPVTSKGVIIRVHIVKSITDVVNSVLGNLRRMGKREVDPVSDVKDLVSGHKVAGRIPQVDSVPSIGLNQVQTAFNVVADDLDFVPGFHVDTVQSLGDY
jgi:hypothetical protein